jgi:hypothetical protein
MTRVELAVGVQMKTIADDEWSKLIDSFWPLVDNQNLTIFSLYLYNVIITL